MTWARLGILGLCLVPTTLPAATATPPALPDSVIARTSRRDLTQNEVRSSWLRLEPRYRPAGEGMELKRAFVEQLLEKEAMAQAALAQPFVMTEAESSRFIAYRGDLERRSLFTVLIVDSAVVQPVDRDSARARMVAPPDGSPIPPEAIEGAAKDFAQRRRLKEVEEGVKRDIAPVFDDAVVTHLAAAYATADTAKKPAGADALQSTIRSRWPQLAPGDSLRVLARSNAGDLSIGEFVRRFAMLNPFQNPLPTTVGALKARSEQFLGQLWFDAEVARRNFANDPAILALLAERRESIALDHWYERNVRAVIDTSQAALEKHYAADPSRFGVAAHSMIRSWAVPTRATADSLVTALAAGAAWDSICARFARPGQERENCLQTGAVADDAPDTALVANLKRLPAGGAYVREEPQQGVFRVLQLVVHNPKRIRPFAEARTYVVRDLSARQAEDILTARMAAARKALVVTVNERAITQLSLEP